jgi:hypothetical protein
MKKRTISNVVRIPENKRPVRWGVPAKVLMMPQDLAEKPRRETRKPLK